MSWDGMKWDGMCGVLVGDGCEVEWRVMGIDEKRVNVGIIWVALYDRFGPFFSLFSPIFLYTYS
jgi:hypothetical protein